jgi:hypothetical protein
LFLTEVTGFVCAVSVWLHMQLHMQPNTDGLQLISSALVGLVTCVVVVILFDPVHEDVTNIPNVGSFVPFCAPCQVL